MKNKIIIALLMVTLCLLTYTGLASAYQSGYSNLSFNLANAVTYDGKWTSTTEWTDATPSNFGQNAAFREKFDFATDSGGNFVVGEDIMIETWDNTNNTGDYYQVCIDTLGDGASAPAADDYRIDIYGQSTTNVTWYKGTGTAWAAIAAPAGALQYSITNATSPTTSAVHFACEMRIDKTVLGANPEIGLRVAVNDARVGGYGLQSWPPTSPNTPSAWGDIPYDFTNPIPESLNLGVIIALSSVAVVAGSVIFQKRSKIANIFN